jgi:hypothetical protein
VNAISIPPTLEQRIARECERTAKRLGLAVDEARRVVEIAILTRGLDAVERERR